MSNPAYEYQKAMDAAETLCDIANHAIDDPGLTLAQKARLVQLAELLPIVHEDVFKARRDKLMPEASDETVIHKNAEPSPATTPHPEKEEHHEEED